MMIEGHFVRMPRKELDNIAEQYTDICALVSDLPGDTTVEKVKAIKEQSEIRLKGMDSLADQLDAMVEENEALEDRLLKKQFTCNTLIERNRELEAISDKLPVTSDGMVVVPGMKVYRVTQSGSVNDHDVHGISTGNFYPDWFTMNDGPEYHAGDIYSTRVAAENAVNG